MKNLFLFLLLIIFSQIITFAQSNVADNKVCPSFSIQRLNNSNNEVGISFKAVFEKSFNSSNLTYKWKTAKGEITGGQETNAIILKGIDESQDSLEVVVKVTGLPEGCINTTSYRNFDCGLGIPNLVSEYEKVSFDNEKLQLDKLAVELKNNPDVIGFIFKAFPSEVSKVTAYQNLQRILNYLQTCETDISRISLNLDFNDKYQTKLFTISTGVELPLEGGDELLDADILAKKLKTTKTNPQKKPRRKD